MNPADRPLVSVVLTTFNRPRLLPHALESVAAQTWRPLQVIVVNDGGPSVLAITDAFRDRLDVTCIEHSGNLGVSAARNTALAAARGEWIAYLDDDDRLHPHHVATMVARLTAAGAAAGYADAIRVEVEPDGDGFRELRRVTVAIPHDPDRLVLDNYLTMQSVVHRRSCLDTTGLFDTGLRHREDWEFWIRMNRHYGFIRVPEVTSEYHYKVRGPSLSNDTRPDIARVRGIIYNRHADLVLPAIDRVLARALRAEAALAAVPPPPRGWLARLRGRLRPPPRKGG